MNGHSGAHWNHKIEKPRLHSKADQGEPVMMAVTARVLKIPFATKTRKVLGIHCFGG
jgi:hypothetical protein